MRDSYVHSCRLIVFITSLTWLGEIFSPIIVNNNDVKFYEEVYVESYST